MPASKPTTPFWRPKRRLLTLERALAPERQESGKNARAAQALAGTRARDRLAAESKKKGRFADH